MAPLAIGNGKWISMEAIELQHSSVLLISTRLILYLRQKLFFHYVRRGWENMWWFLLYWYYRRGEHLHKEKSLMLHLTSVALFDKLLSNKGDKERSYLFSPLSAYTERINWLKLSPDAGPTFLRLNSKAISCMTSML